MKGQVNSLTWAIAIIAVLAVGYIAISSGYVKIGSSASITTTPAVNVNIPTSNATPSGSSINVYGSAPLLYLSSVDPGNANSPVNASFTVFDDGRTSTVTTTGASFLGAGSAQIAIAPTLGDVVSATTYANGYLPNNGSITISGINNNLVISNPKAGAVSLRTWLVNGAPVNASNNNSLVIAPGQVGTYINAQASSTLQGSTYVNPYLVVYYNTSDIQSVTVTPLNGGSALTPLTNTPQRLLLNYARPYTAVLFPLVETSLSNQGSSQTYAIGIQTTGNFAGNTTVYTQIVSRQPYVCSSATGALNGVCTVDGVSYNVGTIVPNQFEDVNHNAIANQDNDSNVVPIVVSAS